jgi:nucleoside-diphosphate-sugar epimerase
MRAIQRGLPLPLGALQNRRSLVALDNLCDFIALCAQHPAAVGQAFVVSDGEDLSTPELVRSLARAMDRQARLLAVPAPLVRAAALLCKRQAAWQRLSGNLQVDITKARTLLGWSPPVSVDEGLRRAAAGLIP